MNKTVINSTEGGAHIKGTIRMPLKETIKKYCQKPINKSKLTPLLELADDGNELVSRVIPLLKNDIDVLDSIIKNSRKGMAVNAGISNIMKKTKKKLIAKKHEVLFDKLSKQSSIEAQGNFVVANHLFYDKLLKKMSAKNELRALIKLSQKNFIFSEAAHIASAQNPLVNVAIYGASRQIQGRRLKVDETLATFFKDKKIADIRMERNNLILGTAKKASESLIKSYKKTWKLLKKYDKTKDDKLLRPIKPEKINLKDAEDYFTAGNWAHPLLDAEKYISLFYAIALNKDENKIRQKLELAYGIRDKATTMQNEAIQKAKQQEIESAKYEGKLIEYNSLIEESKEAGKKKDFDRALKSLRQAIKLIPKETEARWGLATCLHHLNKFKEAIKEYQKLVTDFPDNHKFRFELGQVLLLSGNTETGLKEVGKVMEQTDEFDSFLFRIGEIYSHMKMYNEAITAYESYLEKFPYDYKAWSAKGDCLIHLKKNKQAEVAYKKASDINPNYQSIMP